MPVYRNGKKPGQQQVVYVPVDVPVPAPAPPPAPVLPPPTPPPPVSGPRANLDDEAMRQLAGVLAKEMAAGNLMGGLNIGKVTDTVKVSPKG